VEADEVARNWMMMALAPGEEWLGRARYAAAMFFYRRGEMSAEVLEAYRICSRFDGEDPRNLIRESRGGEDWMRKVSAATARFAEPPPSDT
jgi:hypothetical protein